MNQVEFTAELTPWQQHEGGILTGRNQEQNPAPNFFYLFSHFFGTPAAMIRSSVVFLSQSGRTH